MMARIVSGGQTGVDRAALDVALALTIPCGGWCPKDRRAEDGPLPSRYPLKETPSAEYEQRTEWNVRDSDGTLILTRGEPTGGTAMTVGFAKRHGKPCLIVDLDRRPSSPAICRWITAQGIRTLNVAGPRDSKSPGIHEAAATFLRRLLGRVRRRAVRSRRPRRPAVGARRPSSD